MNWRQLVLGLSVSTLLLTAGCADKSAKSPRPDSDTRPPESSKKSAPDSTARKSAPPVTQPKSSEIPKTTTPKTDIRPKESAKVESRPTTRPKDEFRPPTDLTPGAGAPAQPSTSQPSASRPTTHPAVDGNYEIVKVFYGTNRTPAGTPPDRLRTQQWSVIGALSGAGVGLVALLLVTVAFVGPGFGKKIKATFVGSMVMTLGLAGFWIVRFLLVPDPVYYGDQTGPLAVGTCDVSIPKAHQSGQMEAPDRLKAEVWDPNKHVMLLDVVPKSFEAMLSELKQVFKNVKAGEKQTLVFVHGFNVTFEDAARRTAQMAYDLEFPGAPVFFSWPSKGILSPAAYEADEAAVDGAVASLKLFLTTIAAKGESDRIHLVAHSMGNRALTGALTAIARDPAWKGRTVFHEVMLTAPDVRSGIFDEIYRDMRSTAVRTTLYASKEDAALKYAARWVHNELRVGDCSRAMVVKPGMESIDVSDVETDLFGGHWYYAENRHVLADLKEVLRRKPADGCDLRQWLRMVPIPPQAMYWRLEFR